MCDNSFQTSLSFGPTPRHPPHPLFHLFLNTKIHESLAPGVTGWWIKFYCSPCTDWNPLSWAEYLWLKGSLAQGHILQSHAKWNWWVKFSNFVLEKCSLQSPEMRFIFLPAPSCHICLSAGEEANGGAYSCLSSRFMCRSGIYGHSLIMGPSKQRNNGQ